MCVYIYVYVPGAYVYVFRARMYICMCFGVYVSGAYAEPGAIGAYTTSHLRCFDQLTGNKLTQHLPLRAFSSILKFKSLADTIQN